MLNTKRTLAAVILLCASVVQAQVVKQSPVISDVEAAKWATLRTVFTTKLAESKTFMNKLGSGMKNHARILTFVTEIGGTLIVSAGIMQNAKEASAAVADEQKSLDMIDRLLPVSGVATIFLLAEAIHYVYKKTGSWLEKEPLRCKNLLTDVAAHWQDYNTMVPVVLHPLFEKLADDTKIHGKLTLINDNDACKLVESIMAMSVVLGTKK